MIRQWYRDEIKNEAVDDDDHGIEKKKRAVDDYDNGGGDQEACNFFRFFR